MNLSLISEEFQNSFRLPLKNKPLIEKPIIKNIMRIGMVTISLLITTSVQLLFALPLKSQPIDEVEIRVGLNNETLVQAFQKVEAQSPFHFMYRNEEVKNIRNLSLPVNKKSVEEFLKIILAGTYLTYRQINDQILIMPAKNLISDLTLKEYKFLYAPEANIVNGKITNSKGDPLVGVSITIKGTNIGTSTDGRGNYSITVPENVTLVFSYVGFITQEVAVNNRTTINVQLQEENTALNEVVVTALGIKREAKSLTYSAQTIKADKLNEAKESNLINSLQGKIAGVVITRNATGPGSSSKVLLRGNRSITGSNQPLYVIDGVPLDNSTRGQAGGTTGGRDGGDGIGMLNSDDVETMTILKGASAAALYGSQGQNGAIVITTKKGKSGKISVDYTGNISFDQANPQVLPQEQSVYGQGAGGLFNANSEQSWGPKMTGQQVTLWNGNTVPMEAQPDRLKKFFRTATTLTNTVSIAGGSEKMQTYFSYGNTSAQGILDNQKLNRNNIDLKISNTISSKLSFFTKLTYINESVDNKPVIDADIDVAARIYRGPVSIPLSQMQNYEYFDSLGNRKQSYWKPGSVFLSNPYWVMNRQLYYEQKDRIIGLVSAQYKFTDWLDLQIRGSLDGTIQKTDEKAYRDSYNPVGLGEVYTLTKASSHATNVDALLSFKHSLTKNIYLNGIVGGSIQESKYEGLFNTAQGLFRPDFFVMQNAAHPLESNYYGRTPQVQSLYATATLAYKEYLYLDLTGRNDWSSALPKANQSYFYPSVGLSAIVSNMVKLPFWVSYGKVRISLANSGYGGTQYLDQNYFTVAPGGFITTPTTRSLGNYKPELTSSFEAGMTWQFFNNRLGFDVTYYNTLTKNQLLTIATPYASLFSNQYINAGLIKNNGVELTVNATPIQTKVFSWDVMVNFAANNNKVIRLTDQLKEAIIIQDRQATIKASEGGRFGDIFMVNWQKDSLGRRLVDANGMVILTPMNSYVGNYNPDYNLGFSNTFAYKNLSLSFLIDYRHGGTVVAGTQAMTDQDGVSKRSLNGRETGLILDAYTVDGKKNTKSITPESFWGSVGGWTPVGDLYTYSGTNLRLRELVLGYRISNRLISKTGFIQSAKLSLVGRNLFFFFKSAPFDPEMAQGTGNAGATGMEWCLLPSTRNIGLNLKLSF